MGRGGSRARVELGLRALEVSWFGVPERGFAGKVDDGVEVV